MDRQQTVRPQTLEDLELALEKLDELIEEKENSDGAPKSLYDEYLELHRKYDEIKKAANASLAQ